MKTLRIGVPPGIGDAVWALCKVESILKVVEGLQPTHQYKLDQRGWGDFCGGMFIAHHIRDFI